MKHTVYEGALNRAGAVVGSVGGTLMVVAKWAFIPCSSCGVLS